MVQTEAPQAERPAADKTKEAIAKLVGEGKSEAEAKRIVALRGELAQLQPTARRKPSVDPNESGSARFVRIAKFRGSKVIQTCKQLENLASGDYVYTPEQAEKLVKALETAVAGVARALRKDRSSEITLDLD